MFLVFSRLTREQLNPSLKEYVEKYGTKDYHGEANEINILCSDVDSITFHDDTNMSGTISVSLFSHFLNQYH